MLRRSNFLPTVLLEISLTAEGYAIRTVTRLIKRETLRLITAAAAAAEPLGYIRQGHPKLSRVSTPVTGLVPLVVSSSHKYLT